METIVLKSPKNPRVLLRTCFWMKERPAGFGARSSGKSVLLDLEKGPVETEVVEGLAVPVPIGQTRTRLIYGKVGEFS